MKRADVVARVREIAEIGPWDDEALHIAEDRLYLDVLTAIDRCVSVTALRDWVIYDMFRRGFTREALEIIWDETPEGLAAIEGRATNGYTVYPPRTPPLTGPRVPRVAGHETEAS